jgi:uncharacterized integral membrane protein (TIGR00697 family)
MNIILVVIWTLLTLAFATVAALLAKRYGIHWLIGLFTVTAALAGILSNKMVLFGPLTIPGGVLLFSMTFFITDVISEKWNKELAQQTIMVGFLSSIMVTVAIYTVIIWPTASFAIEQAEIFAQALGMTPRIVVAGLIAYLISQNIDVFLFHKIKTKTNGKHLWVRNNGSTVISQLFDTTIFTIIAFYGVLPLMPVIISSWLFKILIAALDTPFIYLTSKLMDKIRSM